MKLVKNQKSFNKIKVLALLMACLMFTMVFSNTAHAATANGTVNGIAVHASLSRNQTSASASTTSDSSSIVHQVALTLWYYYTGPNGAVYTSKSDSKTATNSVSVSVTGTGSNVATAGAISNHHVYAGAYTWSVTLRDPANFVGN